MNFINRKNNTLQNSVQLAVQQMPKRPGFMKKLRKNNTHSQFRSFYSIEDMGKLCPLNSIFHFAYSLEDSKKDKLTPIFFAKGDSGEQDMHELIKAIRSGQLSYSVSMVLIEGFPLLREVLGIYDRPSDPMLLEGLGDIAHEDLHNYIMALIVNDTQEFVFYKADNSMAVHVKFAVNNDVRERYFKAFINASKAYGSTLRPIDDFHKATSRYQMISMLKMPTDNIKIHLA